MKTSSKIKVDFKREDKSYSATFDVKREKSGLTYSLHADVFNEKGKKIFSKDRPNLDYSQIEHALVFVFHQAFVEE